MGHSFPLAILMRNLSSGSHTVSSPFNGTSGGVYIAINNEKGLHYGVAFKWVDLSHFFGLSNSSVQNDVLDE